MENEIDELNSRIEFLEEESASLKEELEKPRSISNCFG